MADKDKTKEILNRTYAVGNAFVTIAETFYMIGCTILIIVAFFSGGTLGFVGEILLFLIKAILVIVVIVGIIGVVYFIYNKTKGNDVDFRTINNKVKEFTSTTSEEETTVNNVNVEAVVEQNTNDIIQPIENGINEEVEPENNEPEPQASNKSNDMFCGGCGKKVARTIKFCPYCGKENKYTRL